MKKAKIGMIGLGVMGRNLACNMKSKGFDVAVYDLDTARADAMGADTLFSEAVPAGGVGLAVMNRLGRAAAFHIIEATGNRKQSECQGPQRRRKAE